MLSAPAESGHHVRFDGDHSLDDHLLDTVHHSLVVHSYLLKVPGQLRQVPLTSTLFRFIIFLTIFFVASVSASVFNIIFIFLVDGVIGQMHVTPVTRLLAGGVLLSGETH